MTGRICDVPSVSYVEKVGPYLICEQIYLEILLISLQIPGFFHTV